MTPPPFFHPLLWTPCFLHTLSNSMSFGLSLVDSSKREAKPDICVEKRWAEAPWEGRLSQRGGVRSFATWVTFPSHNPDSLNFIERANDYIDMTRGFGDFRKVLKLKWWNPWMSEYPCLYHEETNDWIYPLQPSLSPVRLWKLLAIKMDHDTHKKPSMLKTIYHSMVCNIKRLQANPNVHHWGTDWTIHVSTQWSSMQL